MADHDDDVVVSAALYTVSGKKEPIVFYGG